MLRPSHAEIEATAPEWGRLPITATGYLSQLRRRRRDSTQGRRPRRRMSRHGLGHAAKGKRVRERKARRGKQLSLFSLPLEGGRADEARPISEKTLH